MYDWPLFLVDLSVLLGRGGPSVEVVALSPLLNLRNFPSSFRSQPSPNRLVLTLQILSALRSPVPPSRYSCSVTFAAEHACFLGHHFKGMAIFLFPFSPSPPTPAPQASKIYSMSAQMLGFTPL